MSQILKSLQLATTGSAPGTPNSEFGVVYASGSNKFFFKNSSGTEVDISTPGRGRISILYYTGSAIGDGTTQTYTWNKPVGLKFIEVCCIGAGGGGGGGGRRATGTSNVAGCGGGGGAVVWATFDSSILASSYTITVGAGGAGGIGSTTISNSPSNSGSIGGTSSFGTLVVARGGSGGSGGTFNTSTKTIGGNSLTCTPAGFPYALNGCSSGTMLASGLNSSYLNAAPIIFDTAATPDFNEVNTQVNTTQGRGGGGGGYGSGLGVNLTIYSASRGSNGYQFTTLVVNGGTTGSGNTGQNATAPTNNMITTLLQFTGSITTYGLGGGGHGGGYATGSISAVAGSGSNGGLYGAGGGGGGNVNSDNAAHQGGNGGSGSSGLCIITEFY